MPELPEVETTRQGLIPHILNQTVSAVEIRAPKLRWPIPKNISKLLPGQKIHAIERRAKYLLLKTDQGTLIIHLGMSGRLRTLSKVMPAQKHDHVDITFTNGNTLRYTDPRRFGAVLWTTKPVLEHELLCDLGPEPLTDEFTAEYLHACTKNKKIAIKVFIMNPKVVVGVGNIYACEALFAAGINPRMPTQQLTLTQAKILTKQIKRILTIAIKNGGTTLRDFLNTAGKPGYFSQKLQVYGREKEACYKCNTIIEAINLGQRNTFYCPKCQS